MLVAVVGTDRNEVETTAHSAGGRSWVSIRLTRMGTDHAAIDFSISLEVARELAAQLPKAISDAERFVAQPTADAADA